MRNTLTLHGGTRYCPRPMRKSIVLFALLLAAACSEPRKEVRISEALPTIPLPPASHIIGKEIGEQAVKVQLRSSWAPDDVAAYYRDLFGSAPWRLVSDVKTQDGTIVLYAEQDGPPIWVSIWRASGSEGSYVDLTGAKPR
jgi:hypothetical protein